MYKRVVRVTREEFETEDGTIYPINPPLTTDMEPEEFQGHYDRACNIIKGIQGSRGNDEDLEKLGCGRKNKGRKDCRKAQKNTPIRD